MSAAWQQAREGGTPGAIALMANITRCLPRAFVRHVLLWILTIYFLLMRGDERRASRAFLARVQSHPVRWWHVARHIHTFATTLMDRFYATGVRKDAIDIEFHDQEPLYNLLHQRKGAVAIGSHIGPFDLLRIHSAQDFDVPLTAVMRTGHNPSITNTLRQQNASLNSSLMDPGQVDTTTRALRMKETVEEGGLVALLGDRVSPTEKQITVPFLGAPAQFPLMPFLLAATMARPVYLFFPVFGGGNSYHIFIEKLADPIRANRRERREIVNDWVVRYVQRLEHYARRYPYNWFNFYDFWNDAPPDDDDPAPADSSISQGRAATSHGRSADDRPGHGHASRPG